jgi:hypothetical protein
MAVVTVDFGKSFFGGTSEMQGISGSTGNAQRQCSQSGTARFYQCSSYREEQPEASGFVEDELMVGRLCLVCG